MSPSSGVLFLAVLLGCISNVNSNLNLYMDTRETLRLLGINFAQLFYVRNGIINKYALSFNLPIRNHIDEIYFTWQSLRERPPDMYYSMKFILSNRRALKYPETNISNIGTVPNNLSVFKIKLACTGLVSAEVDVTIQMNISIFSASNQTVVNIKRKKLCSKDEDLLKKKLHTFSNDDLLRKPPNFQPGDQQSINNPDQWPRYPSFSPPTNNINFSYFLVKNHDPPKSPGNVTTSTHIFYIAVGCACAVILLIALGVAVYYLNSQKSGSRAYNEKMSDTSSSQALTAASKQQSQTYLRADTPNNASVSGASSYRRGVSPAASEIKQPTDPKDQLHEIAIERTRISLGDVLLEGTFGRIYHGTLLGEDENEIGSEQEIFIKTLTDQARPDQVQLFLTECCLLKGLVHPNVNPVIAACLPEESKPLIIYPYTNEGNLKKFLLQCRMSDCGSLYSLNTQQLVYIAVQLIRGVQYLHRKKIIHKDVAARNCVLDGNLTVRLTDNSLSRDLFPADYNCLGDNENRPVKWLAPEAILEKRFSPASDVWAFGVFLWELMTLAQQPYSDIDSFEMAAYLQEGYRIAQPLNCPDELFSVMACCWTMNPDERPKFSQLLGCLQDFYTALGRYI